MRWPLTIYTDSELLLGKGNAACMRAFVIFIGKDRRDDEGLYQHELMHVIQSFTGLIVIHALLYWLSDSYRLECEVDAYKRQLKYSPGNEDLYAEFISTGYDLPVTEEKALQMLRQ